MKIPFNINGNLLEVEFITDATITNGTTFVCYDAKSFFRNIVKQNLKEFYRDETNPRKAVNACITLYHLTDWYAKHTNTDKKEVWKEVPYNNALESVANGTKHFNRGKAYQTGRKEVTGKPTKLILANDEETLEVVHVLRTIEDHWDSKLKDLRGIYDNT